ncbi:hypothetical protein ABK040_011891 [Willaertia magna]
MFSFKIPFPSSPSSSLSNKLLLKHYSPNNKLIPKNIKISSLLDTTTPFKTFPENKIMKKVINQVKLDSLIKPPTVKENELILLPPRFVTYLKDKTTDIKKVNLLFRQVLEMRKVETLMIFFSHLLRYRYETNIHPNDETLDIMLELLFHTDHHQKVEELFYRIEELTGQPPTYSHESRLLNTYYRFHQYSKMEQYFLNLKNPNITHVRFYLLALLGNEDYDKLSFVVSRLGYVRRNAHILSILLRMYTVQEDYDNCEIVLSHLLKTAVIKKSYVLESIVNYFVKSNQYDRLEEFRNNFNFLIEGHIVDIIYFEVLCKANNIELSEKYFYKIGKKRARIHVTNLLLLYVKNDRYDKLVYFFPTINNPTDEQLTIYLDAFANIGDYERIEEISKYLPENVKETIKFKHILLKSYANTVVLPETNQIVLSKLINLFNSIENRTLDTFFHYVHGVRRLTSFFAYAEHIPTREELIKSCSEEKVSKGILYQYLAPSKLNTYLNNNSPFRKGFVSPYLKYVEENTNSKLQEGKESKQKSSKFGFLTEILTTGKKSRKLQ